MDRQARITLDAGRSKGTVSPLLYGHFAEHIGGVWDGGIWVGEGSTIENVRGFRKALVESFRKIRPAVLRWPGGCFAETYDWRDGIGPREKRPERINWWYSLDGRTEKNAVGTHEFVDLCRLVGAQPYIAANMTSATPLHIRNWMEYCNAPEGATTLARERGSNGDPAPFGVVYWGIGNENWGGGGQMTPEMYAREYVRYSTVCNSLGRGSMRFIMCGANGDDVDWTRRIMAEWARTPQHEAPTWGVSVHYYCGTAGDPQTFTEDEWYELLFKADRMRGIIRGHREAMDGWDPQRQLKIVVDEWGCWHRDGTGPSAGRNLFEQQSSMRDAVIAAMTLNTFNENCDIVGMANVAQLCNNLHSLYLADGENFAETPNYHVFALFADHGGGRHVCAETECDAFTRDGYDAMPSLSASATEKDGILTLTLANADMARAQDVRVRLADGALRGRGRVTYLYAGDPHACNTFGDPQRVMPASEPVNANGELRVTLPPASVAAVRIERG